MRGRGPTKRVFRGDFGSLPDVRNLPLSERSVKGVIPSPAAIIDLVSTSLYHVDFTQALHLTAWLLLPWDHDPTNGKHPVQHPYWQRGSIRDRARPKGAGRHSSETAVRILWQIPRCLVPAGSTFDFDLCFVLACLHWVSRDSESDERRHGESLVRTRSIWSASVHSHIYILLRHFAKQRATALQQGKTHGEEREANGQSIQLTQWGNFSGSKV